VPSEQVGYPLPCRRAPVGSGVPNARDPRASQLPGLAAGLGGDEARDLLLEDQEREGAAGEGDVVEAVSDAVRREPSSASQRARGRRSRRDRRGARGSKLGRAEPWSISTVLW